MRSRHFPLVAAFVCGILATLLAVAIGPSLLTTKTASADTNCQTFPQTGHQVCGKFLTYWNAHGGLAQQGYPISDPFTETNAPPPAGDGQPHTVQYFERARFEAHDENQPPYDVLLGLLGSEQVKAKYPNGFPGTSPTPTPAPATQPLIVNSKSTQTQIGDYNTAKAGDTYLIVDLTLTNTTTDTISSNPFNFRVHTQQGYDYNYNSSTYALDKSLKTQDIQPGQSVRGQLAFEVPTNETPASITFDNITHTFTASL